MMLTTRYLTNQLLFQRDRHVSHDNRRNGGNGRPRVSISCCRCCGTSCAATFRNTTRRAISEETRGALLNLCSYAYDHEVRLAARMVLDYISARMAVSSNDLRRMVPFRRRNEGDNVARPRRESCSSACSARSRQRPDWAELRDAGGQYTLLCRPHTDQDSAGPGASRSAAGRCSGASRTAGRSWRSRR